MVAGERRLTRRIKETIVPAWSCVLVRSRPRLGCGHRDRSCSWTAEGLRPWVAHFRNGARVARHDAILEIRCDLGQVNLVLPGESLLDRPSYPRDTVPVMRHPVETCHELRDLVQRVGRKQWVRA